jgi:hypothetical protein
MINQNQENERVSPKSQKNEVDNGFIQKIWVFIRTISQFTGNVQSYLKSVYNSSFWWCFLLNFFLLEPPNDKAGT